MASAQWYEARAAELSRHARRIPLLLGPLAVHSSPDVWRGAAADRFRSELSEQRARLAYTAGEVEAAAAGLRRQAAALRAQCEAERLALLHGRG